MPLQRMPVPMGGYKPPTSMGRGMGEPDADDRGKAKASAKAPAKSTSAKSGATKKTGTTAGKSNALGHGGRAAQLAEKGVPKAVIGMLAREKHAAPGQANYHGKSAGGKGGKK